jgi:hypothetical protein
MFYTNWYIYSMKTPDTKLIENKERLFDLAMKSYPPFKKVTCIYCGHEYEPSDVEYPQVVKYGWCIRCEDIHNDYVNDSKDTVYVLEAE